MEAQNAVAGGWVVDSEISTSTQFKNESDGARVAIESFSAPNSMANYVLKSQYVGISDVMGRVRCTVTLEEAVEAANEHMAEFAN